MAKEITCEPSFCIKQEPEEFQHGQPCFVRAGLLDLSGAALESAFVKEESCVKDEAEDDDENGSGQRSAENPETLEAFGDEEFIKEETHIDFNEEIRNIGSSNSAFATSEKNGDDAAVQFIIDGISDEGRESSAKKPRLEGRGRIVEMWGRGLSPTEIARQVGVARTTVYKWVQRWERDNHVRDRPKAGAPRRSTADETRAMTEAAKANPFTSAAAIRDQLQLGVSAKTIRRRLLEEGIHLRTPAYKEPLTEAHRESRRAFAQEHQHLGLDFWSRVIWSDERTFFSTTQGVLRCWNRNNRRYARENMDELARSGHITCNVWGWIFLHGVGEMAEIEERFTAEQYLEILEEVLLPSVRSYAFPYPERIVFMQDGSPIHKARIVLRWFEEQRNMELLEWPTKGCDMNPIEHIWGNIVNVWEPEQEQSSLRLFERTKMQWERLRGAPDLIYRHVASMPEHLQEVIIANGGWTQH